MTQRISVCIPTYNRPAYVEEALRSVLDQDLVPYEVLIGDDSSDCRTARLTRQYEEKGAPVRYLGNEPSLGQARNVDRLFHEAKGDFIVLLHDDDRLLKGALTTLLSCFEKHPDIVAAFGKQQVTDAGGNVKLETTAALNEGYYRTSKHAGRQPSALRSAIIQQFPNDGYMIRADLAKHIGYNHGAGSGCDFAFGVELAKATNGTFYFTDTFTAQYRLSEESIGRGEGKKSDDSSYQALKIALKELTPEMREDPCVSEWLQARTPVAISAAARMKHSKKAFQLFFGPYHRYQIATPGGLWRLLQLVRSCFGY